MKSFVKFSVLTAGMVMALNVSAESRIDAVWECKLKDDQEISDVHAANSEWVKHVNGATDVGEIRSATVEAIVGSHGKFYFVDSYPSLAAWSVVQEYTDSDAGKEAMKEIQDRFDDLFTCSENTLHKFTPN